MWLKNMITEIVELLVAAVLIGALGVTVVNSLATPANTTGWTTGELAVWASLGTIAVVVMLFIFVKPLMHGKS